MTFGRLAVAAVALLCCSALTASTPAVGSPAAEREAAATLTATSPRFGASIFPRPGETYRQAYLRSQHVYGQLGAVRVFYPGLPADWATITSNVGTTPVVVSFKAPPNEIVAGLHDSQLRQWFATAPTDRVTWWSYYHEPENDVATERITAEMYKLAWTHVAALADSVGNPQLRATLTLMCWTTEPASGRDWRDYYAGNAVIDVLAWDCYNSAYRKGRYRSPSEMFARPYAAARSVGKPWAVAEFGSVLVAGDNGRGRASWLRSVASYLRSHAASYGTYFDSDVGVDYRLHDRPSRRAWRQIVRSQWS